MNQSEMMNNQQLLTDYLLGRLEPQAQQEVRRQIEREPELLRLHDDLRNTLAALDLAIEIEPPADLVERTLARIGSAKRTDALLAREQLTRRDVIRPTFSMREVAAVAGIVLLIGSIFALSFREADRRRLRVECSQNVARIGSAMMSYANRNEGRLPSTTAPNDRWLPTTNQPSASNSRALFRLIRERFLQPPTFQCPAVGGDSFTVQPDQADFPSAKFIGYSYQHSIGPKGLSLEDKHLQAVKESMAILADSSPVFNGGRFQADCLGRQAGDNHDSTGQTVLYMDMHVDFKAKPSVGVGGNNIYLAEGVTDYKGNEKPTGPTDSFLLPAYSPSSPETEASTPQKTKTPPAEQR
jgi:hypothetical protein